MTPSTNIPLKDMQDCLQPVYIDHKLTVFDNHFCQTSKVYIGSLSQIVGDLNLDKPGIFPSKEKRPNMPITNK